MDVVPSLASHSMAGSSAAAAAGSQRGEAGNSPGLRPEGAVGETTGPRPRPRGEGVGDTT